ncbi:hypothetical protein E4U41_000230 [Claviceps citrina]|nr:hypothetical protein E4U41_000230 [Claviceps citrina]
MARLPRARHEPRQSDLYPRAPVCVKSGDAQIVPDTGQVVGEGVAPWRHGNAMAATAATAGPEMASNLTNIAEKLWTSAQARGD